MTWRGTWKIFITANINTDANFVLNALAQKISCISTRLIVFCNLIIILYVQIASEVFLNHIKNDNACTKVDTLNHDYITYADPWQPFSWSIHHKLHRFVVVCFHGCFSVLLQISFVHNSHITNCAGNDMVILNMVRKDFTFCEILVTERTLWVVTFCAEYMIIHIHMWFFWCDSFLCVLPEKHDYW